MIIVSFKLNKDTLWDMKLHCDTKRQNFKTFIHSFIQSHGFHRIVNLIWHVIMKNCIPPKPTGLKHRKCCTQGDNIVSAHRWLPGCKLHRCVYTAQVSVVIGCLVTHHHLILQVLWLKIHHNRQLCYEEMMKVYMMKSVECTNRFICCFVNVLFNIIILKTALLSIICVNSVW